MTSYGSNRLLQNEFSVPFHMSRASSRLAPQRGVHAALSSWDASHSEAVAALPLRGRSTNSFLVDRVAALSAGAAARRSSTRSGRLRTRGVLCSWPFVDKGKAVSLSSPR